MLMVVTSIHVDAKSALLSPKEVAPCSTKKTATTATLDTWHRWLGHTSMKLNSKLVNCTRNLHIKGPLQPKDQGAGCG